MTQVILSSHSTFMPQLSGNDSHGLCHLTQEQSTDILHLCGFHKFTYQHTHTDICTCKLNVCFSFLYVFFKSDYGLYAAAVIYIRWVLHLLSHAGVAAVLCYILQVNQQSLTTFAHSCVFFPPKNSPMADLRCISTAINMRNMRTYNIFKESYGTNNKF